MECGDMWVTCWYLPQLLAQYEHQIQHWEHSPGVRGSRTDGCPWSLKCHPSFSSCRLAWGYCLCSSLGKRFSQNQSGWSWRGSLEIICSNPQRGHWILLRHPIISKVCFIRERGNSLWGLCHSPHIFALFSKTMYSADPWVLGFDRQTNSNLVDAKY